MEACISLLISTAATLGLSALGVAFVVIAPLPSPHDDGGSASPSSLCRATGNARGIV